MTTDKSTQTAENSPNTTQSTRKSHFSAKFRQRLKRQRKKINNLVKRITKLKIQNQRTLEEMEHLQKINMEQYEQLVVSDSDEHSLTFTVEKSFTDDTLRHEHTVSTYQMKEQKHANEIISNSTQQYTKSTDNGRSKVLVLADQQGRGIQKILQRLLGDKYDVFCFWKSGGQLHDLLNSCVSEIPTLTKNDYVVLFGFINDDSLSSIRERLLTWFEHTINTNIMICENLTNRYLKEGYLNNILRKITGQFTNTTFIDMEFSKYKPKFYNFPIIACRFILREVLRLHYMTQYRISNVGNKCNCSTASHDINGAYADETYNSESCNASINRGTQTDFTAVIEKSSDCGEFFRV